MKAKISAQIQAKADATDVAYTANQEFPSEPMEKRSTIKTRNKRWRKKAALPPHIAKSIYSSIKSIDTGINSDVALKRTKPGYIGMRSKNGMFFIN